MSKSSKTREHAVLYEQGPTSWGATVPDLPGCFAVGETREEVEERIEAAITAYIAYLEDAGEEIPEPRHTAGSVAVCA